MAVQDHCNEVGFVVANHRKKACRTPGFGMIPFTNEGAPIHPDALAVCTKLLSNEAYQKMLDNYRKHYSDEETAKVATSR